MSLHIIDDRDPVVNYTGRWVPAGSGNEYRSTTTSAYLPGLTANLTFRGTGVSVHGTIGAVRVGFVSPISSYSIDGATPVSYRANQTQFVQYNQRFYQSPVLPDGQHTLIVTNTLYSSSLYLDYFVVQPANATTTSVSNSPSSSSTSLASSGSSSTRTTAVVVGCVVGGVAGVVILLIIFLIWFRRQKQRKQAADADMVISFPQEPTSVAGLSSKTRETRDISITPSTTNGYQASNYSSQNAFPQYYETRNTSGGFQQQPLPSQTSNYPYDLYFNPAIPPGYVSGEQNQDSHPPSAITILPSKLMARYQ